LTGSAVIRGLLITGMFSTFFIGALYFEHVLGYSPVKTGVAFLPQALVMAALSTGITAKLVDRFGSKFVMYPGMAMAVIGLVLLASAGQHAEYFPKIFIAFLLLGAGAGLAFMPLLQIGMSEVPSDDAGLGSGVVNVSQQMAGAIGLAVLSTIASNRTKSLVASGHAVIHSLTLGYQLALYIAAGSVLVGLLVSPFLLKTVESPEEQKRRIQENMLNPETKEHLII
jgi:MFS family permease